MEPCDPAWEFETLVLNLNKKHFPGSVSSGKTRNALIRAWALCVGRQRANTEFHEAIARYGSRNQLIRVIHISRSTLVEFERFLHDVPERGVLPRTPQRFEEPLATCHQIDRQTSCAFRRNFDATRRCCWLARGSNDQIASLLGGALRAFDFPSPWTSLRTTLMMKLSVNKSTRTGATGIAGRLATRTIFAMT